MENGGGNPESFGKAKLRYKVNHIENSENVSDPKDVNRKKKNLFVFDDIMTFKSESTIF